MSIPRIPKRSAMTIEEAIARHPSARTVWTPADFAAAVADALELIRDDTATVYDFATGKVIK